MIILDPANSAIKMNPTNPTWKLGTLQKGLVLDMPLSSKYYNPSTDRLTDRTPYENHGANNGGDVATDHTTFVAANSDYVDCGNNIDEQLSINQHSFSVWIKADSLVTNSGLIGLGDDTTRQMWVFQGSDGKINYSLNNTSGTKFGILVLGAISVGVWAHFTGSMDGTLMLFYKDGNLIGNESFSGTLTSGTNNNFIGYINGYSNFNGSIADVKIYNRALSQQEITLLYDKGRGN